MSIKFHHFSDFQNHVAFRAILRPEYEGYIRNTIYRCEKDGQTQILVISDFWIFNFCHTDFCKPFSWIFNFCKKSNNQKTARTKSQFSQQPSKLGIEVGGVLKIKNRAEQLLFYALNKKTTPSCEKTAPKLTRILTLSIFVKNKIIKKQPVLNGNFLSNHSS